MSSGISPVFTLAEGENYYGYSNATGGNSIESGKPLGLIRNVARVELSALSLDMTQVKVNNSQKYKSGTIKFVPKDVFVLHGRKKANVADQSISNTAVSYTHLDVYKRQRLPWPSLTRLHWRLSTQPYPVPDKRFA